MKTSKHGRWTEAEDKALESAVNEFGEKNWRLIAEKVSGRSTIQCLHRWSKILKPGLVKGPWTPSEDDLLKKFISEHGPGNWSKCAGLIPGRSGKQCRERWHNALSPEVKKGNWDRSEDALIYQMYLTLGPKWTLIAKYLPGRTENSIKNRFYSHLRKVKGELKKSSKCNEEKLIFLMQRTKQLQEVIEAMKSDINYLKKINPKNLSIKHFVWK